MSQKHSSDLLVEAGVASLDDSLRKPKYQGNDNPLTGHCYVFCESLFHLLGGLESGWVPHSVFHEKDTHWFLRHRETGAILDPTAKQFKTKVPYEKGRGRGFLTREPSKRAQELINRISAKAGLKKTRYPEGEAGAAGFHAPTALVNGKLMFGGSPDIPPDVITHVQDHFRANPLKKGWPAALALTGALLTSPVE